VGSEESEVILGYNGRLGNGVSAQMRRLILVDVIENSHFLILVRMDSWRIAVLGDGGVGKTALVVQVSYWLSTQ
jgi:GTPase SAR1 family protein